MQQHLGDISNFQDESHPCDSESIVILMCKKKKKIRMAQDPSLVSILFQ